QVEDGIRGFHVTGVQKCALPIYILGSITKDTMENRFGYQECDPSEANVVMIFTDGEATHAGKYDPASDTYSAKGGGSQFYERTGMTKEQFYEPYIDNGMNVNYNVGQTIYYKKVEY